MTRVKRSVHARKKRRATLARTKGYRGEAHSSYRRAKEALGNALITGITHAADLIGQVIQQGRLVQQCDIGSRARHADFRGATHRAPLDRSTRER